MVASVIADCGLWIADWAPGVPCANPQSAIDNPQLKLRVPPRAEQPTARLSGFFMSVSAAMG
jgi:hypothetical protein